MAQQAQAACTAQSVSPDKECASLSQMHRDTSASDFKVDQGQLRQGFCDDRPDRLVRAERLWPRDRDFSEA